MRNLCITLLAIGIFILSIGHCLQEVKIANLERKLMRIEQGYDAVLTENQKMERMNDQILRLMSEGGWNGVDSMGTDN